MGMFTRLKGLVNMILSAKAKNAFDVGSKNTAVTDKFIDNCLKIYQGNPDWVDEENHIKTINFAQAICSEIAQLTTLAIAIKIDGSARAQWLQEEIDKLYYNLRHWVEYGCASGTIIVKPNGSTVDMFLPTEYLITNTNGDNITGAVFQSQEYDTQRKKWFTRLEYHRTLDNGLYAITNKCFIGDTQKDAQKEVAIETTPWNGLYDEVFISNIDRPLFGTFRTPLANNIDFNSPLSLPIFANAVEELMDLDVAYSRNVKEIYDSKRTILLDSDRLLPSGRKITSSVMGFKRAANNIGLPDYVKCVYGNSADDIYHEINPQLNTDARLTGINSLLSQIGYKCGFDNGHFVFNEKTGVITATQVEAEQQRTIRLIKDVRDKLQNCIDGVIYALDKFADLYDYAPVGTYEINYSFGDITYSYDEDKKTWWSYVLQGKVPAWRYFVKFEGMSEDEAKEMQAETQTAGQLYMPEE